MDDVVEGMIEDETLVVAAARPAESQPSKDEKKDEEKDAQKDEEAAESRSERIKSLPVIKQATAVELLERSAKLSPDSEVGRRAASDLESLQADKEFKDALDRHLVNRHAERLYNGAELFRKAELYAKALEYYVQVAEQFPDTEFAKKAKEKATEMRAKIGE